MSLVINDNEVMSEFFVDNKDRKYGTPFNFVCPLTSTYINFNGIKRMAMSSANMSFLPYTINELNRYFSVTDGVNTYQVALPIGYWNISVPSSTTTFYLNLLQTALNANPYGWVFTLTDVQLTGIFTWVCSVPVRVSQTTASLQNTLGIHSTSTLSANYSSYIITGTYSNVYYVCSKALTKDTVRDATTNTIINNVLGIISINDQLFQEGYYNTKTEYRQMKVFDFEQSTPIGGEIDIYVVDSRGRSIIEYPQYESLEILLEFKIVSTRNSTHQTFLKQY